MSSTEVTQWATMAALHDAERGVTRTLDELAATIVAGERCGDVPRRNRKTIALTKTNRLTLDATYRAQRERCEAIVKRGCA